MNKDRFRPRADRHASSDSSSRPRRRWRGKITLFLFLLCLISILTQVFWPGKSYMLATKVGGVDVSGLTPDEARVRVSEIFEGHILRIETESGEPITTIEVPLDHIAIDAMIAEEIEYPLWQRIIPFSSFFRTLHSNWIGAAVNLDVDEIMSAISSSPVDAHIRIIDGKTIITESQSGFVFDRDDLSRRLSALRLDADGDTVLRVSAEATAPAITDESIAHLLAHSPDQIYQNLLATFRGTEFSLAAASLDDTWDISVSADDIWTSASTYKLYVAYYIFKKVDAGDITYSSVKTCMEAMIIDSDNSCPENWLVKYGFKNINAVVQSIGGLDRTQIKSNDMETAAHDLALFLTKLYRGELLSEESTNRLIDIMKRQRARTGGIPAGVGDNVVANKVGWIFALLHDAAIVFSDSGDYVLVILTDGSSWSNIAELTSIVNTFNTK